MSDTVTIRMSEEVHYFNTFTLAELAEVLGVEPTRGAVFAALDERDSDYGTATDDDSLLNHMVARRLTSVENREWVIVCSWREDHPAGPGDAAAVTR